MDDVNNTVPGDEPGTSEASGNSGTIHRVSINEEMRGSYLDYAMSVIVSRALPDSRDGLKPVHRRILYAMYDMGLRPNTSHKKSARIVGEVLGKYHPHGDTSVYDAMARMTQDFSLRYPLVDGQGNFGSQDGDSPAAMRYTEARMASMASEMLADINMDTVNFVENYDGSQYEPSVLPARLPNLLLNGASGIAVGMSTNIPPHNLRELSNAIVHLIDNYETREDITVQDLMQFIKGPDFPTGAEIIVGDELIEAYSTGKGRVIIRSSATIEIDDNGNSRIIFTSLPYQASKATIIDRIVNLVRLNKIDTIRDLRDESDRDGQRLVVELKRHAQPKRVLNQLYKYTPLQSSFSIQMLALVNDVPRNLSLKRSLEIYIEHRYDVIVRRSEYELQKLRDRAHILNGLLKAVTNIDEVIRIIRGSDDVENARQQLMTRFELDELQANAILDMQLRRLAALERQKLQDEYDQVSQRIDYLEDLIASPGKILDLIRDDVVEIADRYGDDRKTAVIYGKAEFSEYDLVRKEQIIISLTERGYIKRMPARQFRAQRRGGRGMRGMATRDEDVLLDVFAADSHDTVLFFTDRGKVYSERAYNINETSRTSRGVPIQAILSLEPDEHITSVFPVSDFEMEDAYFVMATVHGRIKRVHLHEFASVRTSGLIAMSLMENDTLDWVKYTSGDEDIIIVTTGGQAIRFNENDVRVMGRGAAGVNAIRLDKQDTIAGMDVVRDEDSHILVVTQQGFGKRTPVNQYNTQSRYGYGVRTLSRHEGLGAVVAVRSINEDDDIVLITRQGVMLRTTIDQIRETGRSTKGVRVMRPSKGDEVVGIAIMPAQEDEDIELLDEELLEEELLDAELLDEELLDEELLDEELLDDVTFDNADEDFDGIDMVIDIDDEILDDDFDGSDYTVDDEHDL